MSSVAFVTAYIKIYEDDIAESSRKRNLEWRMELFYSLADTGLRLFLFCSPEFEYLFSSDEFKQKYPNVTLVKVLVIEDTWTWQTANEVAKENGLEDLQLPEGRNIVKDTKKYVVLQNAKVEFVNTVMELFPQYEHYSWIDFSIVSILKEREKSLEYMKTTYGNLYNANGNNEPKDLNQYFFIPGCWKQPWYEPDKDAIMKRVHWRFCGGFFIADHVSMQKFTSVFFRFFPEYLREFKVLTWEVNFWAWLEIVQPFLESDTSKHWKPEWFQADHNDSMIKPPVWAFVKPLLKSSSKAQIEDLVLGSNLSLTDKPQEGLEWSGSSSFVNSSRYGRILNTRVMNYWIYPNGYYRFHGDDRILRTRNLLSFVNSNGQPITTYPVIEDLGDKILAKHKPDSFSQGLEDIRLWTITDTNTQEERVRFICTNFNYSPTGQGRMIVGDLVLEGSETDEDIKPILKNAVNIVSPRETWMEKNWVPLVLPPLHGETEYRERFIYQWSPFELGELKKDDDGNVKLELVASVASTNPNLFDKVRGSSCFIPYPPHTQSEADKDPDNIWLGVIHFSEEGLPRKYYHMLVTLDGNGIPHRYSSPFQYCKEGIEFCIGFEAYSLEGKEEENGNNTGLRFWISRHDRDPALFTVPFSNIPLTGYYKEKKNSLKIVDRRSFETATAVSSSLGNPRKEFEPQVEFFKGIKEIEHKNIDEPENITITILDKEPTHIHIYVLCYNEELLIPHTINHYRNLMPSCKIIIYDNESTDRSVEIAKSLGCEVVSWNSENIQNEYIQRDMRNNIWKTGPEKGWKFMIDMDEWLCVTEKELEEEEEKGTTILRVKGVNVMGCSESPNLEDYTLNDLEGLTRVVDWSQESKNLCFLTPYIKEMNYTHGAHACFPKGTRIQFSEKTYYNKHMENLGLPFFIQKFVRRAERNKIMHAHQINLHYTDDIKKITDRYEELMGTSYVVESFDRF